MEGDVFGKSGDFITSPEISQVFGEVRTIRGIECKRERKGNLMDTFLMLQVVRYLVSDRMDEIRKARKDTDYRIWAWTWNIDE